MERCAPEVVAPLGDTVRLRCTKRARTGYETSPRKQAEGKTSQIQDRCRRVEHPRGELLSGSRRSRSIQGELLRHNSGSPHLVNGDARQAPRLVQLLDLGDEALCVHHLLWRCCGTRQATLLMLRQSTFFFVRWQPSRPLHVSVVEEGTTARNDLAFLINLEQA